MGKEMENIHNHYDRSCIKDLVTLILKLDSNGVPVPHGVTYLKVRLRSISEFCALV